MGAYAGTDADKEELKELFGELIAMSVEDLKKEHVPHEHLVSLAEYLSSEADSIQCKLDSGARYDSDKEALKSKLDGFCNKAEKAWALIDGIEGKEIAELRGRLGKNIALAKKAIADCDHPPSPLSSPRVEFCGAYHDTGCSGLYGKLHLAT